MVENKNTDLYRQIAWDYHISADDLAAVIQGKQERAGHYTQKNIFKIRECDPQAEVLSGGVVLSDGSL